jgi:phosphoglycolate phosphatase-like HAD superfamily hydrolase
VPPLLVLWDLDYTLVNARGLGLELYQRVWSELHGSALPRPGSMAGRTDRAIAREVVLAAGLPDPESLLTAFQAGLNASAPAFTSRARELVSALPGAATALAGLAEAAGPDGRPDAVQSLLTGNIRLMAEIKVAAAGLAEHLDLAVGAYGDSHEIRAELVGPARELAALAYGHDFGGSATVLVGDTPLDVEAALATGSRAVAVATGHFTAADLAAAGAHAVLPDLADTAAVLAAIRG